MKKRTDLVYLLPVFALALPFVALTPLPDSTKAWALTFLVSLSAAWGVVGSLLAGLYIIAPLVGILIASGSILKPGELFARARKLLKEPVVLRLPRLSIPPADYFYKIARFSLHAATVFAAASIIIPSLTESDIANASGQAIRGAALITLVSFIGHILWRARQLALELPSGSNKAIVYRLASFLVLPSWLIADLIAIFEHLQPYIPPIGDVELVLLACPYLIFMWLVARGFSFRNLLRRIYLPRLANGRLAQARELLTCFFAPWQVSIGAALVALLLTSTGSPSSSLWALFIDTVVAVAVAAVAVSAAAVAIGAFALTLARRSPSMNGRPRQPGYWLLALVNILFTGTSGALVFEETISDLQLEYRNARKEGRSWNAQHARIRGYCAFWNTLFRYLGFLLFDRIRAAFLKARI